MRKTKPKEGEKRSGGRFSSVLSVLLGAGLAFALVFLLLLAVAALTWSGVLKTGTDLPAALCVGLAAFVGGRFAVRMGEGTTMSAGLCSAMVLCMGLGALCLLYGGTVTPSRGLLSVLLLALAGGSLAGLMGRRKRRVRPGKR